jgi:hypothetical protein
VWAAARVGRKLILIHYNERAQVIETCACRGPRGLQSLPVAKIPKDICRRIRKAWGSVPGTPAPVTLLAAPTAPEPAAPSLESGLLVTWMCACGAIRYLPANGYAAMLGLRCHECGRPQNSMIWANWWSDDNPFDSGAVG